MDKKEIKIGQLLRIKPTSKVHPKLRGQLVIVEQVREWGILGVVILEGEPHPETNFYPVRVDWKGLEEVE